MSEGFTIRPIEQGDNPMVAQLIRAVMPEFGASGPGFAIHDPEVDAMCGAYSIPRAKYFVIVKNGKVFGAGGFAPLKGEEQDTCEVRKMYFYPELRGLGFGRKLLDRILAEAKLEGFKTCYLETFGTMTDAHRLYEKAGFQRISKAMGCTGHHACDIWYQKSLNS